MNSIKIFTAAVFATALSILFINDAKAQLILGTGLGVNYSNLTGLDNTSPKIGGNLRTVIGYRFSQGFALHLEPMATLKGAEWQFDLESEFFPGVDTLRDIHTRNYTLMYLDFPLLGVISFPLEKEGIIPYDRTREQDAWLDFYIGPVVSMFFAGTVVETKNQPVQGTGGNITRGETVSDPYVMQPWKQINGIDIGACAGVGVRFYLNDRWRFTSSLRYTQGFLSVDYGAFRKIPMEAIENETDTGEKDPMVNTTNGVASLNVGFLYEIRKR